MGWVGLDWIELDWIGLRRIEEDWMFSLGCGGGVDRMLRLRREELRNGMEEQDGRARGSFL